MNFRNIRTIPFFLLICVTGIYSCRKSDYVIARQEVITDQGGGTGTTTWNSDRDYLLDGFVFVNDGQMLTIEPGTVVRGRTGQGSLASALIVARGGKIIAEGERNRPIIFTAEGDDLEGSVPVEARGLWGGLIILGNAMINTPSGEDLIEGIPISEPRGVYGGFDDDDNSGILRYVSIRHGGTNIGEGNEINGLTLGGVGRQTMIDYVEVISNADDGVEFFGGDVNCQNLLVAWCGDDAFDMDQGFHGKGQFWVAVNSVDSDKTIEVSGGLQPVMALPDFFPVIHNATLLATREMHMIPSVQFDNHGNGLLLNSILLHPGTGVAVSYTQKAGGSYDNFTRDRLAIKNCILFPAADPVPAFYCYSDLGPDLSLQNRIMADSLIAWGNSFQDPGISVDNGYLLLPPQTVFENLAEFTGSWFERVAFKGAFGSNNWVEGWSLFHETTRVR